MFCLRVPVRLSGLPMRFLAVTAILGLASGPALSQSFFQSLFGFGTAPAQKAEPKRVEPRPGTSLRSLQRSRPSGSGNSSPDGDADEASAEDDNSSGPYRTLCVRTCDGYYFPISPRASQSRFKRDARMCKQMCGHETKLFYMDRDSTNMKEMLDVDGEPYSKLPNAFSYRKSLVNGCACRPMPWSEAERARHAMYSVADSVEKAQRETFERQLAAAKANSKQQTETTSAKTAPTGAAVVETASTSSPPTNSDEPAATETESASIKSEVLALHLVPGISLPIVEIEPEEASVQLKPELNRPRRNYARLQSKPKQIQTASWQFGGGSKHVWPGDRPVRRR